MKARAPITLLDAINDKRLFKPWIRKPAAWEAWFAFIAALFALPMTPEQLTTFTPRALRRHRMARRPLNSSIHATSSAFNPEAAIAKLESMIDALPESPHALAPDVRAKRIEKLTEKLNELEQLEEDFIRRAEDEDTTIARRLDANPAAVLGVIVTPKAALNPPKERSKALEPNDAAASSEAAA